MTSGVVHSGTLDVIDITASVRSGASIDEAIAAAIQMAGEAGARVTIEFNGTPIQVRANSEVADVSNGWSQLRREHHRLIGAYVGPEGKIVYGRGGV
jgi:hypothetical protein